MTNDALRCRYSDCPEQHPIALDTEDGAERDEPVTCPTCRKDLGLPPLTPDRTDP